jgi:hypothetical protein
VAEQLAENSSSLLELTESQPPNTDSFYTNRPLPSTDLPKERQEVVSACLDTAQKLIDAADELLACVNKCNGQMVVPGFEEFASAASPGLTDDPTLLRPPEPLLVPETPEELAYCQELCRVGGKNFDKLSKTDQSVLSVSLSNHRRHKLAGGFDFVPVPTVTDTGVDLQIEQLRQQGKL